MELVEIQFVVPAILAVWKISSSSGEVLPAYILPCLGNFVDLPDVGGTTPTGAELSANPRDKKFCLYFADHSAYRLLDMVGNERSYITLDGTPLSLLITLRL